MCWSVGISKIYSKMNKQTFFDVIQKSKCQGDLNFKSVLMASSAIAECNVFCKRFVIKWTQSGWLILSKDEMY